MTQAAAEPVLTARLELLLLEVADADEVAVALADPALHAFIGGEPSSAAELRARFERLVAGSPDPAVTWWNWVIRLSADRQVVGTMQATLDEAGREAEIAWVVGSPWQGLGIAKEAAGALVTWLRTKQVQTITAHIHPDHHASAGVARAAGLGPTDEEHDGEVLWSTQARE